MFERFFGKRNTDKLVDSIANKTSEKIAEIVSDTSKLNSVSSADSLDIRKKELEVALLELDKQKREQEVKKIETQQEKMGPENEAALKKASWHRLTSIFISQGEFDALQSVCKMDASPQEIQGLVQAVGQVRAARITALGAIVATGIGGAGLWIFQQTVSNQKRQADEKDKMLEQQIKQTDEKGAMLKEKESELNVRIGSLNASQSSYYEVVKSLNILEGEVAEIDKFVEGLCQNKNDCLENYRSSKEKGRKEGFNKYEEIKLKAQHDAEAEVQSSNLKNRY